MVIKTIENYIEDICYDDIIKNIKKYVYERHIYLRTDSISYSTHQELDDIEIKKIYFKNDFENEISEFKAKVLATFVVEGKRGGDYEQDEADKTFTVTLRGNLSNQLKDAKVVNVDETLTQPYVNYKDTLSSYMLPYMKSEEMDVEAEKFLLKYCPEALNIPMALPIEEIIKKMGITKYNASLGLEFGRAYFDEAEEVVYKDNSKEREKKKISKKTIIVDPEVQFLRNFGSYNFTVIHECVHIEYHYKYFQLKKILYPNISYIACILNLQEPEALKSDDMDARKLMEWQANTLAPKILMPKNTVLQKYHEFYSQALKENPNLLAGDIMDIVIGKVADFYQVSRLAAKIRLIDLGIDTAEGAHNYVNNQRCTNFSFKEKSLNKDQTYIIDFLNSVTEIKNNPALEKLSYEGKIAYVNGMVVINSPKYVRKDENNKKVLTDYALEHVDECAFVFDRVLENPEDRKDYIYSTCFICHTESGVKVKGKYNSYTLDNETKEEIAMQQEMDAEERNAAIELKSKLTGNFNEVFYTLIINLNNGEYLLKDTPNVNKISTDTKIHHEVIEGYLKNKKPEKKNALKICCGLKLYPMISFFLLEKAGCTITNTDDREDWTYCTLINEYSDEGFGVWNYYLECAGFAHLV